MADMLIAAKGCVYSSDCAETGLNNNRIIVGGSGSGKTMSVTEPCLLHSYERNLIVTATKSRIVHKYRSLLQQRGYRVEVLDFSRLSNCTVGYDPMRFVRTSEDVLFLAQSLVLANPRKENSRADPYWDEMAVCLLCAERFQKLFAVVGRAVNIRCDHQFHRKNLLCRFRKTVFVSLYCRRLVSSTQNHGGICADRRKMFQKGTVRISGDSVLDGMPDRNYNILKTTIEVLEYEREEKSQLCPLPLP